MDVRAALIPGALLAAIGMAGCSPRAPVAAGTPAVTRPHVLPVSTPTLAQQIRRAEKVGPGTLNYCPTHNGVRPAEYSVTVPGSGVAGGWCRTAAQRVIARDRIIFTEFWDARKLRLGTGSQSLTYEVARRITVHSTPVPVLVAQHGMPPP